MQALGAARLGLATALVAPIGRSGGAGLLRGFLESEGVEIAAGAPDTSEPEVPTTALLDNIGGRRHGHRPAGAGANRR